MLLVFGGYYSHLLTGLKLITKESVIPRSANKIIFFLSPVITFVLAMAAWAVVPWSETSIIADIDLSMIYIFAISSLTVYGIIMAGWSSNSRYAFLGFFALCSANGKL